MKCQGEGRIRTDTFCIKGVSLKPLRYPERAPCCQNDRLQNLFSKFQPSNQTRQWPCCSNRPVWALGTGYFCPSFYFSGDKDERGRGLKWSDFKWHGDRQECICFTRQSTQMCVCVFFLLLPLYSMSSISFGAETPQVALHHTGLTNWYTSLRDTSGFRMIPFL